MIEEASVTSCRDRLPPPVMFSRTPRAPSIEPSSSSGLEIARWVASTARLAPCATPIPMTARPMWPMTVRTSAKSTLTSPGTVMTSAMPLIACRSTSSATLKASRNGVVLSTTPSSRWFGITNMVSTCLRSSRSPSSARVMRLPPSNRNGLVTTATVSALSSRATLAMIGAAPVPVPPPIPAVTKTMSAPTSASRICSASCNAAWRPISGFAPAPSPFCPMRTLVGALEIPNACMSVLTAMNSTPTTPAAIMELTALQPPPPAAAPVQSQIVMMVQGMENKADAGRVYGIVHLLANATHSPGVPSPRGEVQHALRNVRHSLHQRRPAGEHHPARDDALVARPFDLPRDEIEDLLRTRLDHVRQQPARERARRPPAHAGHIDHLVVLHKGGHGAPELDLDPLGVGHRRLEADGDVVGEIGRASCRERV